MGISYLQSDLCEFLTRVTVTGPEAAMGCAFSCLGYYVCCPFTELRIRCAHATQLWLLKHPGQFSSLLKKFYITDFILHANPNDFWQRRRAVLGKNFCSVGKVVVSEKVLLHKLLLGNYPFLGWKKNLCKRLKCTSPFNQNCRPTFGEWRILERYT